MLKPFLRGGWETTADALALVRGEATVQEPVQVRWSMGGQKPAEVVWTGMAYPVIVHECVLRLIRHCGFTGWSTYPVVVLGRAGQVFPDYHGLAFHGRCGPEQVERGEFFLRQYPGGWCPERRGRYFVEDRWDGNDFFMEEPDAAGHRTARQYVSGRVRNAFVAAKFRNIAFEPLSETTTPMAIYTQSTLPAEVRERIQSLYKTDGLEPPAHWQ